MSADSLAIDVIIVTTGARDLILSCLEHLERQTVAHRTFVADNGGNADGTSDAVRERFPDVTLLTLEQNIGFGNAMNRLARLGAGDVVVLANDDMDVEPEFLERLVEPLADEQIGMVAGMTLQPVSGEIVDGFGIEVDPTLLAFNRLRHQEPGAQPGVLLGPSGGAAAYRRTAWEVVGGFEPSFFVYFEDVDLALRLRGQGWRAAAAPAARGVHLGGATTGPGSPFQRQHGGFGRGFVLRRFGVLRGRYALRALAVEALSVVNGVVRSRTLTPLRARIAGWRAAGPLPRHVIPPGATDKRITMREALRRMLYEG